MCKNMIFVILITIVFFSTAFAHAKGDSFAFLGIGAGYSTFDGLTTLSSISGLDMSDKYMVNASLNMHFVSFQYKKGQPILVPKSGESGDIDYEGDIITISGLKINTDINQYELYGTYDNFKKSFEDSKGFYYSIGIGGAYNTVKLQEVTLDEYINDTYITSRTVPSTSLNEMSFCAQATLVKGWAIDKKNEMGIGAYATVSYNSVFTGNLSVVAGIAYCMWGI